jgi:hypothetical protein
MNDGNDRIDSDAADGKETSTANTDDSPQQHSLPTEIGGRNGPEPVRYGDWEKNGRCIDF